ncbi:hypothetical protein A9P82_11890 [Arachidicoccus ginsenosidimutans]|uniref:SusC/RagA family TonB-linked outer membrane protein n=1 Tax=Arachidicoccus sp. BS20 TaxID=1850526 RepID=UPI0007F0E41C|nr:SusC/RagA family TonB-linked outer membrane protein [Arachidicoccus sp. BS20]ANI89927.1 hypothetical protein A9P82_11890 [Arachidicoccus sp. BS20]
MRKKLFKCTLLLFSVLLTNFVIAQTKTISGIVLSSKDSLPISGSSVELVGTKKGTLTNTAGKFELSVPESGSHISVKEVGYETQVIDLDGAGDFITVYLKESNSALNEVVVTAAGTKVSKIQQGFATTTLDNESLTHSKPTSLASALAGKVPGLQVMATGGGLNPSYRITIRGQRSLLGNNQPLLILDGNITSYDLLSNINPEDIDNLTVLNGPSAVAVYGGQASNGALVITTKHPAAGTQQIHIANTTTWEHVSFLPKLQTKFGSGGAGYGIDENGNPYFSNIENQSYGPAFDGSIINLGDPLENGDQLTTPYSYFEDRNKFWQTGLTNQTDFSLSSADVNSSFYLSGQWLHETGTPLGDKFTRASIRLNGTRKIGNKVHASYGVSYLQNRYNVSSATSSVYTDFLNMPPDVPITLFKDWQTNEYANPNGYYNPWYANPYFVLANNRSITRNDYLTGSLEVHYTPFEWLDLISSTGYTMRNVTSESWTNPFYYTDYAKSTSSGSKSDIVGGVSEGSTYTNQLLQDFKAIFNKKYGNFSVNAIGGFHIQQDFVNNLGGSVSALIDSNLINLSNSTNPALATNSKATARQLGAYYDVQLGWKNMIFLHTTGRNDWVSILNPGDRSFFYPSVDASLVLTRAFSGLSDINWLNTWKIRAAASKVGEVNLGNTFLDGAYRLNPTYGQVNGYPYNGVAGEGMSLTIIQQDLKPEITKSWEVGTDFTLFHGVADGSVTWFHETTNNQTVTTPTSITTGFGSYLLNAGKTMSEGLETSLKLTPVDNATWTVALQGTYSYYNNKVLSIPAGLQNIALATYGGSGNTGAYAVPGMQFPEVYAFDYVRHDGKVVVDRETGMPTKTDTIVPMGNANARNTIGLIPTIRYKNFTLEADFEYRGGFVRYNNIAYDIDWGGVGARTAEFNRQRFVFPNSVYQDADGSWVDNKTVVIAENGSGNNGFWTDDAAERSITSNYVSSGDYWKLREISLTYQFPASWLAKTKAIKSASVSLVGRNLFIWAPGDNLYTDPDYSDAGSTSNGIGLTGYSYPPSRYYGINISVNF